jgi:hypothetical protein
MQPRYHARQMNTEQAIQRLREVVRRQHKAISTESTYAFWLRRYMLAIPRYPEELTSEQKLERFLTELARDRGVSAVSQNQAFNAVLFFYRDVLGQPLQKVDGVGLPTCVHGPPTRAGVCRGHSGRLWRPRSHRSRRRCGNCAPRAASCARRARKASPARVTSDTMF